MMSSVADLDAQTSRRRRASTSEYASEVLSHVTESVKVVEYEAVEMIKGAYSRTLHWSQLEEWQKDNEFILRGYRRAQNSWKGCMHSVVGYLHNETVNIHSHLLGAILFVVLLAVNHSVVVSSYATTTWVDTAMISVFLASAIFCLSSSSIFHMVTCHSEHVSSKCNLLDYAGIIALILGSCFPSIFYVFYCDRFFQHFYLISMSVASASAAFIVLNPEYSKPSHRGARTTVFIALGLSAAVPATHALLTHGVQTLRYQLGLDWLLLTAALYIAGALLYANRIPERLSPGTFDYFFASHQIFHVMVVLAALSHYRGVVKGLEYWHGRRQGLCLAS